MFFLVCDGLKGLPEAVENVWPLTVVQTCIIHLLRNSFRLVSRGRWDALKRDLKPIYTAPNADAALAALNQLEEKWGKQHQAMIRLWRNAWEEFTPFLAYDVEIRRMICSTNAIESLNARYRRAVRGTRAFPHQASGDEMPVPCHPQPRPHRDRPHPMDDAVEASHQRIRHHVR